MAGLDEENVLRQAEESNELDGNDRQLPPRYEWPPKN